MSVDQNRLREILHRNMFLRKKQKQEILAADDDRQSAILPLLEKMDVTQTEIFRRAVDKEPNFFENLSQEMEARMEQHQ